MSDTKPLAYSPAEMRRVVKAQLGDRDYDFGVLTAWLCGHEYDVMEVTIFPFATDKTKLDHAERLLATLPNVYRIVRITDGTFGRARDLRWQVRALVAMNSFALQGQPLGRGGWAGL